MDVTQLTIKQAHESLQKKEITVPELVEGCLKRIERLDPKIHAFTTVLAESAVARAEEAQRILQKEKDVGPLFGIPMGHKEMFCTAGVETTASSNILRGYIPPYSATTVERLEKAGVICLGKLNCDAFAHGSSTENSDFGPTHNPYDLDCVPGGSSGGSAAAVAASEVLFSTGTDTGGSIRLPAAYTNTVGLKPTYGRVSRYGVIAMTSSTDCPGPITRTVEDCALVLSVMAGHDPKDSTSSRRSVPDYAGFLGQEIKGWRIGVPNEFFGQGLDPEVEKLTRAAISKFEELGAIVEGVSLPNIGYALAVYYTIMPSEVSSNLARYDGIKYGFSVERGMGNEARSLREVYELSREKGFGDEAKRRIILGTYALSSGYYDAYYKKALQVQQLIRRDFLKVFEKYDLLLGPVAPTPPFRLGEKAADPMSMYLSDIYTTPVNLAGNPSLSVPCGFIRGLPVGLQVIGAHFTEEKILQAGFLYEQSTQFYKTSPEL